MVSSRLVRESIKVPALLLLSSSLSFSAVAESPLDVSISSGNWLITALDAISVERMVADIRELSGPTFEGRQTGTAHDLQSATFVANRFSELRLHRAPAAPPQDQTNPLPRWEWKQTAPVTVNTILAEPVLQLNVEPARSSLHAGADFLPILDSPSAAVQASIVFVGYGLSDPAQGVDDYSEVDVRNHVVLFLRGKPEQYKSPVSHADKERTAKQKGAVAYLTATGPILSAYEQRRGMTGKPSAFYSNTDAGQQLPGAWISSELAEAVMQKDGLKAGELRRLQEEINRTNSPRSSDTGILVRMIWDSRSTPGTLYNIASIIRGYGPHSDEAVLVGAHRDHFGRQAGLLFPGADDNASGTAVLLEVARVMAQAPAAPRRSVLFVSFSGEEQNLLGSRLYMAQPIVPRHDTVAMINVDHAGIGNGRLTVGVTGLDKSTATEAGQRSGLVDRLDVFGFFPGGDHVPFYEAGVPTATVVSGGVHSHFHQPTDTADTIEPEILRSAARYVLALAWQLANQP